MPKKSAWIPLAICAPHAGRAQIAKTKAPKDGLFNHGRAKDQRQKPVRSVRLESRLVHNLAIGFQKPGHSSAYHGSDKSRETVQTHGDHNQRRNVFAAQNAGAKTNSRFLRCAASVLGRAPAQRPCPQRERNKRDRIARRTYPARVARQKSVGKRLKLGGAHGKYALARSCGHDHATRGDNKRGGKVGDHNAQYKDEEPFERHCGIDALGPFVLSMRPHCSPPLAIAPY